MNKVNSLSLLFLCFTLFACGGGSSGGDALTDAVDTASVIEQAFGTEGNIWKPEADAISSGAGNLVVLFSSKFTNEFSSCELMLNDGSTAQLICINNQPWTQTPFSCFSNGGRQTWRANFKCDAAGSVEVLCKDTDVDYIFTVPAAARAQVCSRFG